MRKIMSLTKTKNILPITLSLVQDKGYVNLLISRKAVFLGWFCLLGRKHAVIEYEIASSFIYQSFPLEGREFLNELTRNWLLIIFLYIIDDLFSDYWMKYVLLTMPWLLPLLIEIAEVPPHICRVLVVLLIWLLILELKHFAFSLLILGWTG